MYANGMNPEVPPYLALGELNRRKKMEQAMQPAQMPQGTVKEQLEKEVGLAALQKQLVDQLQTQGLRQQQSAMSQGQQMARMPGPAPQGVPQPEVPEEMAEGGVASIRVPDDQFEFGSGGIIAFSSGSPGKTVPTSELDIDPYGGEPPEPTERQKRRAEIDEAERLRREEIRSREERQKAADAEAAKQEFLERAGVPMSIRHSPGEGILTTAPTDTGDEMARLRRRVPPTQVTQGVGTSTQTPSRSPSAQAPAPSPAPQGIATVAYPTAGPAQQALAGMATGPQQPYPSYEAMRQAAEAKDPYLKKSAGEKLEQYLATLERRDREDQERFQQMEKDRTRSALWKSLMAAGEASRGQRGIGALLGGFGRTAEAEAEAARGREEKQRALMREREMNRVKMAQEIESARIAASEGRFKDQRDHEAKAAQYNQENKKIDVQIATTGAQIEGQMQQEQFRQASADARERFAAEQRSRDAELNRKAQFQVAGMPTGEERMAKAFIDSWLKQNPNKTYHEAYAAYTQSKSPTGAMSGERQQLAELRALQTSLKDQLNNVYDKAGREKIMADLNKVNAEIAKMAGIDGKGTPKDVQDLLDKYGPKR